MMDDDDDRISDLSDDERSSDLSDDDSSGDEPEAVIVSGLFGIANEETIKTTSDDDTSSSECSDDISMEDVDSDNEMLNNDNNVKKPDNMGSVAFNADDIVKEDTPILITEKINFGSHILGSKSANSDLEIPSSFAVISQRYEKSRQGTNSNESVVSPKSNSVSKSDSKSSVVLVDRKLPSTLSLICSNYQDLSSDDSSNESSSESSSDSVSDHENTIMPVSFVKEEYIRTRGELEISDLPPIEDLKISVDEEKCQPIGCIKSFVDTLVVVEAFLNQPPLDIDSVLFVDRGQRALGRVFDVFGPVNKPYYAVRFNDSDHIKKFDINIKEPVYCAPQTEYSNIVLVSQLMKMKGSDASWRHNNEPPCEFLDYSDDEAEKLAKRTRKQQKLNARRLANSTENGDESFDTPNEDAKNKPTDVNTHQRSSANSSNWTPKPYAPRPSKPPVYSQGPRHFPTYAQQLSSMEYSHAYRQPYSPWYYDPMYMPRHGYPYPPPPPPPPPSFLAQNYRSQRPPRSTISPSRYPPSQRPHGSSSSPSRYPSSQSPNQYQPSNSSSRY